MSPTPSFLASHTGKASISLATSKQTQALLAFLRDVPARYLLHLGQGEQELATDVDFSREGRVNAMLVRQLELLSEVESLTRSLRLPEDRPKDGYERLKRCILIGDHHQLPHVVKNMAFQKCSHMDQSLFTRFVRLGIPYIELNAQGRA
ncbi:hypothetical protein WN943_023564 [Citrus x changshan-huyou]